MEDRLGRLLMRWRIAAVLPHIRGRLLDLGCGTNELVKAYRDGSGDGIGVDVHPWDGVDQVVESSTRLPFDDAVFDTATVIAALNHIPERRAALSELHRVLRPGGRVILTMIPPGISRIWHGLRSPWDADQRQRGMVEGEVYGLAAAQVRLLLEEADFEVVDESRFMLGLNRLTVARCGGRKSPSVSPFFKGGAPPPARGKESGPEPAAVIEHEAERVRERASRADAPGWPHTRTPK